MTLDDARRKYPTLGLALYALEPGHAVTLEVLSPDGQIFTFKGLTVQSAIDQAFPEEPVPEIICLHTNGKCNQGCTAETACRDPKPAENVFD